jgi:hypothetical protein
VTCYGDNVKNANCPKNQYMVVKFASYRGLPDTKTCGLSDDYSCEVDVTCLVKKQCDGLHECSITVANNLFSGDLCSGLSNYLYFEYQCIDTVKHFNELCGTHGYNYGSIDGYIVNQHGLCTSQICLKMYTTVILHTQSCPSYMEK